jgi:hypothetical protein
MVKEEIEDVQNGNGRYFLSYHSYSVNPDPVFKNVNHITCIVPTREFATDKKGQKQLFPIHKNVEQLELNNSAKKDIEASIKETSGEVGMLHIKSKGIYIKAESAKIDDKDNTLEIIIDDYYNEGIIDGSALYNIIKDIPSADFPKKSYIKVTVVVGMNNRHAKDVIKSNNAKVRVIKEQKLTKTDYEWIDEAIADTLYKDKIDYITILSLINLFRNNTYDSDVDKQPTNSYSDKNIVIQEYKKNKEEFKKYADILPDILYLYDFLNVEGQEIWSSKNGSLASSGLSLPYKQKFYDFPMLKKKLDYKFHDGVSYSILNGLRMYVIYFDGKAVWSKDFDVIKNIFKELLPELIKIVRNHNKQIGYNVHLLGKSKLLYSIMYKELLMGDMLNQFQ